MAIIAVTCGSCRARYRLEDALLEEAKGAWVRCRRCGTSIFVKRAAVPEESSSPPELLNVEDLFELPSKDAGQAPAPVSGGRFFTRPPFLAAVALLLLAAGIAYYRLPSTAARAPSSRLPAPSTPALPPPAPGSPDYRIIDLEGRLAYLPDGVAYYLIRGTVGNVGEGSSYGVRIQAALLGADNQTIAEGGSVAGNIVDESMLRYMKASRVQELLWTRGGEDAGARELPVGRWLPFMVVFYDPPAMVRSFTLKATEAD